mmetsp:Transcript_18631/g.42383  ORF Transcript_18631/g.42383 Transcript_18631/m.42383 type:complete len:132 (-) Transcript_18631:6-401(-)
MLLLLLLPPRFCSSKMEPLPRGVLGVNDMLEQESGDENDFGVALSLATVLFCARDFMPPSNKNNGLKSKFDGEAQVPSFSFGDKNIDVSFLLKDFPLRRLVDRGVSRIDLGSGVAWGEGSVRTLRGGPGVW